MAMIEIIIIIVVLFLLAVLGFFIYKKCIKSQSIRAVAMRNSLVNRNYFFQKPSGASSNNLPYRYNNASNQIYASTTVDFDDEAFDRQRILDEEARKKHEQIHKSWASGGDGSFSSSVETHNLLEHEDEPRPSSCDQSSVDRESALEPAFRDINSFPGGNVERSQT